MRYYREYTLKNGKTLIIRSPEESNAQEMISYVNVIDTESKYLTREPGEFSYTEEDEKSLIQKRNNADNILWTLAVIDNEIVGMAETTYNRSKIRFRHKGDFSISVKKKYWGLGIGGKLMLTHIEWSKSQNLELIRLEVVANNERAISMYRSFGFEIVGTVRHGMKYPDSTYADEHTMIKDLTNIL
jgi:ribosomal protein S18 acetylase RimI-like enzyme